MAAAAENVDPVKRVGGVGDAGFVFFGPSERPEVQQDVAGEVGIVGAEGGRWQRLVTHDNVVDLAWSRVLGERVARIEDRRGTRGGVVMSGREEVGRKIL